VGEALVRYPAARITGFIKPADFDHLRDSKLFHELVPMQDDNSLEPLLPHGTRPFDLCLVPFEDRVGIHYWTFRLIPLRLQIPRIASYNGLRRLTERGHPAWIAETLFVNTVFRAAYAVMCLCRRAWWRVRRNVSVAGLFSLAAVALMLHGLGSLGLNPIKLLTARRLPTGRKKLVLHIPSLGLGGAQRQLAIFLEQMDRSQWDVEVVTVDAVDKFFEPAVRSLGVSIHYLSPHCQLYEVGLVWQLVRYLYRNPCHVLHSWLHFSAATGAISGTFVGIPGIIGSIRSGRPDRFPWFYPPWQRGIDIMTAPLQTLVIANSEAVRAENQKWALMPDRKMVTIYNGIDTRPIQTLLPEEERRLREEFGVSQARAIVGIVGRLHLEKDHATFLRAARLVNDQMPTVAFLIVGGGPLHDVIRAEISALGLQDRVVMTGERQDVLALIQLMDVLVLTSTTEGLPNVLLEAAACGVPVVTTDAGGAAEVVADGETGFVARCHDHSGIAGWIVKLMRDRSLRRRFGNAARVRVQAMFSADRFAAAVQACYDGRYADEHRQQMNRRRQVTRLPREQYMTEVKDAL
jgi:glycosyltransferase involved in cell wall biosynthesis